MRRMKTNSGFWIIIMVLLFSALGVYSMYYFSKSSYLELESKMVKVIKKNPELLAENSTSNPVRIESKEYDHLIEMMANDEACTGYVNVYDILSIKIYKGFVRCGDFKSIGYKN